VDRLIERKLADGRSVASIIFAPIDEAGSRLEFVDVGARNGSFLLPASYAARARITGFEPNKVEYEKLLGGRTDAAAFGLREPPFKERRYFPYAVWSEDTERTLYLTVGPGAVSLMGPVHEAMTMNMWRESDHGQNYFERHQAPVGTDHVTCVALDRIWDQSEGPIDVLKLDVEGAELQVLKGAEALLSERRILLIFSEFLFVPYYQDRTTLGHQQVFLDELGYRLIAINADHDDYNWGQTRIQAKHDRRMTYAGDAIFIADPDRNSLSADEMYRLGLACMAMGFNAFGINLMRETGRLAAAEIAAIEAEANKVTVARRAHDAWKRAPDIAYRLLRALRLRG
jgi:FkbM family methyltransferase